MDIRGMTSQNAVYFSTQITADSGTAEENDEYFRAAFFYVEYNCIYY